MIRQLVYAAQYVLGLDKAGNTLTVFPDDTFIVSYPKSGNTWTRFLIGNLVYPEGVDFSNVNRLVPDPGDLSKRDLKRLPRPRIIKSHQPFDPRYKKVICVVRDPRDVALAEYHFDIKRMAIAEDYPIERFVAGFVAGQVNHEVGPWGENVGSWLGARRGSKNLQDPDHFLLIRYEDLIADAKRELTAIAGFLKIDPSPERLQKAVERSSADAMRKLEKAQAHLWSSTKDTRKDRPFVRSAKSGGWRTELPDACVAEIESSWGPVMRELGYELHSEKVLEARSYATGALRP